MIVHTIQTHKIAIEERDLLALLDRYLTTFAAGSILAITSKVVAICQGRTLPIDGTDKQALIEQEAELFLPATLNPANVTLTIKHGRLIPNAGIDASNGDGHYILWPDAPQQVANAVRTYLQQRFGCPLVGVLITDSNVTPLRLGVTGVAVAHSGFLALNDYVGAPDLFGRPLRMTRANVMEALAGASVLAMGEGSEQTPLAVITDLPFVTFQDHEPTAQELAQLHIPLTEDLFSPLLTSMPWRQGGASASHNAQQELLAYSS
jgi:dihydrofolate synthase / folylpolyglutamate synthase